MKKKMTEKLRQLDTNTYIADDKRTLAQYLDTWFAEFIVPTQKPYTITTYRGVIKNHLKPNLGAVRLCDLTTEQVQKMVRKLVNAGKAPKTIKNVLTVLNSALEQAVKAQTIQRNPAKFAKSRRCGLRIYTPSPLLKLLRLWMRRRIHRTMHR